MDHGGGGNVDRAAPQQLLQPGPRPNLSPKRGADNGAGAMDEHCPPVSVAAFADPADTFFPAVGLNAR